MPSPNPAGPRPWLFTVKIPSGARGLLIYLWTYGPHWSPGDPEVEAKVWPLRRTIREDFGGVSLDTLKGWLRQARVRRHPGWARTRVHRHPARVRRHPRRAARHPGGVRRHPP
jgi:hypothetical protein